MQVTIQIGKSLDFQLTQAILIYEDQVSKQRKFATVHQVSKRENQPATLAPGTLLTTDFLKSLYRGLEGGPRAVLLPENVLVYTPDILAWWTPPRQHRMFFSEGADDRREIHGAIFPHPALVWKVQRGSLYLKALNISARPKRDTRLMAAPYWNTAADTGDVCEGDMRRPKHTDIATMLEWEEGFFNSHFTHPSGIGKLTAHAGGFIGLWTELRAKEQFPAAYLVPGRQTLGQFILGG
jgi:PRTRC genetic system protein B